IVPYPSRAVTPSWIRAPPESSSPTTGVRPRAARSIAMAIFRAWISPSDPPRAEGSWENTATVRPSTRAVPVTTPSPSGRLASRPNAVARWRAAEPNSTKLPSSTSSWTRSRAPVRVAAVVTGSSSRVPGGCCSAGHDQDGVLASEAEGVADRHLDGGLTRRLGDHVDLDLGVLAVEVRRRRDAAVLDGEDGERRLDRPGGPQRVAGDALGRGDRGVVA